MKEISKSLSIVGIWLAVGIVGFHNGLAAVFIAIFAAIATEFVWTHR